MLRWWTVRRASGIGAILAAISLIVWFGFTAWPERLRLPLVLLLGATAACGVSVLWISLWDMLAGRKRGPALRAIRIFDLALGTALTLLPLMLLAPITRDL